MSAIAPLLRLLFWESTSRCNLACLHCRRCETDAAAETDLTTDQAGTLIEQVARTNPPGAPRPIFVFSGGEPLMRDDWAELAEIARDHALPTALASNGVLIDPPTARRIAQAGIARVSISIDGADAATHDGFRDSPGNFERALAGIANLGEAGVAFQINTTVAAHNVDQLDALATLAERVGAIALHLFLLVPVGCGVQIAESHRISPHRYEQVLQWIARTETTSALQLRATCAPHYYRVRAQTGPAETDQDPDRLHAHTRGCLAGIGVALVNHRGLVQPCGYLPIEAGDVKAQPFDQIWRGSELFAELRDPDRLRGKCGRCDYRLICGGCRARAYAATGDYLAAEPMCLYRPPGRQ